MDNTKKENLSVLLEVKAKNFNDKGLATDALEASAKLTKADAGRISQNDEDSITLLASNCGTPTLEANYNSKSLGKGETATTLELEMKGQTLDMNKNELIDAIAAGSKLTKADAGRELDKATEDWHKLKALKNCDSDCASVESYYTTKTAQLNK
jgi:hypothetical protein